MARILEFIDSLIPLQDPDLQAPKLEKFLSHRPLEDTVNALNEMILKAIEGNEKARLVLNPFLLTKTLTELMDYEKRREIYEAATAKNLPIVKALLSDPIPFEKGPKIDSIRILDIRPKKTIGNPNLRRDPITLGERRSLAKSKDRKILEKILYDPDPKVIQNLLNNRSILETDILKLASHRPNQGPILNLLGCHRRWGKNPRIRQALVLNPYTPPLLAVVTLVTADQQLLKEVRHDENLHPLLREVTQKILELKK